MSEYRVTLSLATEQEMLYLKEKMDEAFSMSEGKNSPEGIPNTGEIEEAYYSKDRSVYCILKDGVIVGGVILKINEKTRCNKMDLFFIMKTCHNKGIGTAAWKMIEQKFPQKIVWELCTPYYEKRNINFYVNKCGFHIVEYFNKHHVDLDTPFPMSEDDDGYFRFIKCQ